MADIRGHGPAVHPPPEGPAVRGGKSGHNGVNRRSLLTVGAASTVLGAGAGALLATTVGRSRVEKTSLPAVLAGTNSSDTISIRDFGARGDGATDDTAAIQSALTAAANRMVRFPAGVFQVTAPLKVLNTSSVVFDAGCTIKAVSPIAGPAIQWGITPATTANGMKVRNQIMCGPGVIDCNNLADHGIWIPAVHNAELSDIVVQNARSHSVIVGNDGADGGEGVVEFVLHRIKVDRGISDSVPPGSYGVWLLANSTDSIVSDVTVVGSDTSFRNDGSGNRFETCHGWGWQNHLPSVIFDDNGFQNTYLDCEADTPSQYGFRMRNLGWRILGGFTYSGLLGPDNVVTGVHVDQGHPSASIIGHGFAGFPGDADWPQARMAKDCDIAELPNPYFTGMGNISFNVVDVSISNREIVRSVVVDSAIELGNASDTTLQRSSPGMVAVEGNPIGVKVSVPATANTAGTPGQWAADSNWLYICVADATWVRSPLTTW